MENQDIHMMKNGWVQGEDERYGNNYMRKIWKNMDLGLISRLNV